MGQRAVQYTSPLPVAMIQLEAASPDARYLFTRLEQCYHVFLAAFVIRASASAGHLRP